MLMIISKSLEANALVYLTLVRPYLKCLQFWELHFKKVSKKLKQVQAENNEY